MTTTPDASGPPTGMALPFVREEFTQEERLVLSSFFTNLDGPVYAIVNLPEVVKGALFARYSRSPKSVRRLFLDEFYDESTSGGIGTTTEDSAVRLARAEDLYQRVFTEYGDDSVAQLGGAHLACEQASNVLTKILEWGRLASYLEQSTRYIFYDQKLGGRYRFATPPEVAGSTLGVRFTQTMEWLFSTYSDLIRAMVPYYETLYPREASDPDFVWRSTIRAKACDDLRGLLPAATTSNVGIFASGQAYENLLLRMQAHPLDEVRLYGQLMLQELRKVIPAFMRRVDVADRGVAWSRYMADVATEMDRRATAIAAPVAGGPVVELVEWDPDAETKLAAAALYHHSHLSDQQLLQYVRELPVEARAELIRAYVGKRGNRRHKPGRAFERTMYRFDILADYGVFRDLQRHRMLTIDWQRLSPHHGHVTPSSIVDIGAERVWNEAMERTAALHREVDDELGPDVAQYVVPFAYRIRFYLHLNAREALHLIELRTGSGGHPDYRRIGQEMHRAIRERAGHHLIADAMQYVDHEDHDLARLEGERRAAARRAAAGLADPSR